MFESPLPYKAVGTKIGEQGTTVRLFSFNTPKNRHIITEAHIHELHPLAVVKFFDKAHRHSEDRFSLMSGTGEAVPIIRTAIQVMLDLYEENPYLSFAFMGATDFGSTDTNRTKRYRIYEGLMERFFSDADFVHKYNPNKSLYLMLNRAYTDNEKEHAKGIFIMMREAYPKET